MPRRYNLCRVFYCTAFREESDMRLGSTELILILIIAIALFGTSRIAGIGKAMGKSIREFKEEVNADDPAAKKEEDGRSDEKA
jgi:sec-independent protein translocase protein TatA